MISQKQLEANRKNAQKGGVKTPEGKAIVKYNALKHGLLSKEVVITVGEGAENPEEFNALLDDLTAQLRPEGALEEMLVEKIAVAYWRLRRACKYEAGLIRKALDSADEDFYSKTDWEGNRLYKTDKEIEQDIEEEKKQIEAWKKDKEQLSRMYKAGKSLEDTFDWEENWDWLCDKVSCLPPDYEDKIWQPRNIRKFLKNNMNWSDDDIWQALMEICDERIQHHENEIDNLRKNAEKNRLRLQVIKKLGNIPSKDELERLLRYEGAIERQFYKAINQLERLQRMRSGDNVPVPVEVDIAVSGQGS